MTYRDETPDDDRALVEACLQGDQSAFENLVRLKTPKVYGHCLRMVSNAEDARDISQLVFIRLWEKLEKYDPAFTFDTWLYRLVSNVTIDFVRSRQTRENAVQSSIRLVRSSTDAEQPVFMAGKEVERIFDDVSAALSPKQKEVFVMKEMDDLTSPEIAEILECSESTVRNHLFNARKILRRELERRYPEYARIWSER
ncbi:MAG: RNA polymerase sigma factor [Thermoanaerobaculia bacterium]|nr:RNA polymerase sigma factor [Thermoanaerobaculia bacterium]